ncbi:pentapeptide repeat-containing protein [Argonema antarcticum]|uniref:pentapeptide repeat-containing protein n=1 Tax=Argonema antarcticum TaxID=2942763 RepID=UPI0020135C85|nr:pentapeptide repeat-containing protein [Argonema antarcticum]MCL1469209.1 pentapeptide repeat-containing protein [Argonema antarcticum A004/B2]
MKIFNQDIRSHNFKKISLNNRDFKKAQAGHKNIQKVLILTGEILLCCLLSLAAIVAGKMQIYIILHKMNFIRLAISSSIYMCSLMFFIIEVQELTILLTFISTLATISIIFYSDLNREIFTFSFTFSVSIIIALLGAISIALFGSFCLISGGLVGEFLAFLASGFTITVLSWFLTDFSSKQRILEFTITLISAIAVILTGAIIARKAVRGSPKFAWIREKAVFWATIGGTSFYGSDLTDACFDGADLPHTDFRKAILTRTSFEGATRLDLSRLQGTILEQPKVRKLLTTKIGRNEDYTGANFEGANLRGADLTDALLKEVKALDADFSGANLTGICIENWSINSETRFAGVQCDYIYRELDQNGHPIDQYPIDRNFEPREFESLYQEVGNVVELIFKEGVNWRAFSFTLQKLQVEDEGLGLQLKGIEKRGDLWVVKVTHNENASKRDVEQYLQVRYEEMKQLLTAKEQQINQLLGIATNQAEALKNYSKQSFGNSFFITGSTITNLAGSGQIDYDEAASKIRSIVANSGDLSQVAPVAQNFLQQLQNQSVATSSVQQAELIQQVILTEAKKDTFFKQFLLQQGQQIVEAIPESAIATAIRNAILQLR